MCDEFYIIVLSFLGPALPPKKGGNPMQHARQNPKKVCIPPYHCTSLTAPLMPPSQALPRQPAPGMKPGGGTRAQRNWIYIYIYIERERERETPDKPLKRLTCYIFRQELASEWSAGRANTAQMHRIAAWSFWNKSQDRGRFCCTTVAQGPRACGAAKHAIAI